VRLQYGAALARVSAVLAAGVCVAAPASADLSTFGYGNARLGTSPHGAGISLSRVPRLRRAWSTALDGAIDGQPVTADRVRVRGRAGDLVLVGTGHGQIVAVSADRGRVLWRRRVGARRIVPDCDASPDAEFGLTGTMVVDRRASRVYAAGDDGRVWALELRSGRVVPGWPVRVYHSAADFEWGALTLSRGRLYVPVASLCDTGDYHGGIVAIAVAHPRRLIRWRSSTGNGVYGGGIWGWGGVSIDARTGDVYAATGNSLGPLGESAGAAESVVRLSSSLVVEQRNDPLQTPFDIGDRDFGTTPVLLDAHGCPPQLVAINKTGELFLYGRDDIFAGPLQRISVATVSPTSIPLYGMPAFDPATRTLVLVSPANAPGNLLRAGVQAFTLTSKCRLALRWQQPFDPPNAGSAPTIADGAVYIGTGRDGWVRALRLADGHLLWAYHASRQATIAAPSVDHGELFVGDWSGHLSAFRAGPQRSRATSARGRDDRAR
jgi:outer membrane protein assembly factor BamB